MANAMKAAWLEPHDYPEWDAFVAAHPQGSVYNLSSWLTALEAAFPHMQGGIVGVRESTGGPLIAGLSVCAVRSWLLGNRLVAVPFASVSDPLVTNPEHWQAIWPLLTEFQARHGAGRLEIRATGDTPPKPHETCSQASLFSHHLLDLSCDAEAMFRRLPRTYRRLISAAEKQGVRAREGTGEADLRQFYLILAQSRRRLSLPLIPYRFFAEVYRALGAAHTHILLAELDGQVVAGSVSFGFGGICHFEYIGVDPALRDLGLDRFVAWSCIKAALQKGYRGFDFGRTSNSNEGLLAYKRLWGTREAPLTTFTYPATVHSKAVTHDSNPLYGIMRRVLAVVPMPIYRALGDFCYRHLG
jgi:CelD/BcsL family acetyltransferase involved in cellulose biosynthesis